MSLRAWNHCPAIGALLLAAAAFSGRGEAAEPVASAASSIESLIDDETWFVLYVDFERYVAVPAVQAVDLLRLFRPDKSDAELQAMADQFAIVAPFVREWGLTHGWMMMSLDDALRRGGGALILKPAGEQFIDELLQFQDAAPAFPARDEQGVRIMPERQSVWLDNPGVVIAGTRQIVEHYQELEASPRPDLLEPLNELLDEGAISAAVLSPDADVRRAVRELWPELPPPFDELTGAMLADDFRWFGAALYDQPTPHGQLMIELRDESTAERFETWLEEGREKFVAALEPVMADDSARDAATIERLSAALQFRREGARIILDVDPEGDQIGAIAAMIGPIVNAARAAGMDW